MEAQSQDELFDVVDAGNRVLFAAPRGLVHAMRWRHRAVHIMLQRESGDCYLQRRSLEKDTFPGRWTTSCSGHVDSGETFSKAAIREITEELGIPPPRLRPLGIIAACPATGDEFTGLYLAVAEPPLQPNPAEVLEGRWLPPHAIRQWMHAHPVDFAWSARFLWDRYFGPALAAS